MSIVGVDWPAGAAAPTAIVLEGGRHALFERVKDGLVLDSRPGAPLVVAVEASRTPADRAERDEWRTLQRAGVNPAKLAGVKARREVLAFLGDLVAGRIPSYQVRHAAYLALQAGEDASHARAGARFFRQLFDLCAKRGISVPDDCHWRLACYLRHAGALKDAIASSDVLQTGQVRSPNDRRLLATTRAAALLALWRITREVTLARQANHAFKIAWAISANDEELQALRGPLNTALEEAGID